MPNIGDRRSDGNIFAGSDYGYQSPASFQQLKKQGAFKAGASIVRRLKSSASEAYEEYAPQPVKDFAEWYGNADERINQSYLDRGFSQEEIDAQYVSDSQYQGDATSQFLQDVSDKTNVDPAFVQLGAAATEMVFSGGVARVMSKNALKGLSRAPAPTAYAMGDDLKDASSLAKRIQQNADKRPFKAGLDKDGRPINLETGGRLPSTTSRIDGSNRVDGQDIHVSRVETTPGTGVNKGRDEAYVFNAIGKPQELVTEGGVVNYRSQLNKEVLKDNRPLPTTDNVSSDRHIIPGGSTRNTPKSQAQFDAPYDSKRPRRQFVDEPDTGEWLPDEEVLTSDMARPKSDGNQYNFQDNYPKDIPAVERQRIRREGIAQREQEAISKKIEQRLKQNNTEGLKREVFLADGDYQKLEAIAKELGVDASKYKNASQLERQLNKSISRIENTYGGKASLSKAERQAVKDQFDRETLTGATRAEQKRLTELATQEFGVGQPKRKPLQPLKDTRVKANRQPDIERRKRPYGQSETTENPSLDYDTREKIERGTAKSDLQWYKDRYQFDEATGEFLLDDKGAYIPLKRERSVSNRINRRRKR